jgi:hypothetical protein
MSITYQIFQKASFYLERYSRKTFLADAGQRSRTIIPGDDPGDQQPPEPPAGVGCLHRRFSCAVMQERLSNSPHDD